MLIGCVTKLKLMTTQKIFDYFIYISKYILDGPKGKGVDILFGGNGINPCTGPIWKLLAHGSVRAGEFPTLCSPAVHGPYSRVPQTALGRLGGKKKMEM